MFTKTLRVMLHVLPFGNSKTTRYNGNVCSGTRYSLVYKVQGLRALTSFHLYVSSSYQKHTSKTLMGFKTTRFFLHVLALPSFYNFPIQNMYLSYQPYPKSTDYVLMSFRCTRKRQAFLSCCGPAETSMDYLDDWFLLNRRSRNSSNYD